MIRKILNYPFFYTLYAVLIGRIAFTKRYAKEFINAKSGQKILELGSGCGHIIPFLPEDTDYLGYDLSPVYVDYCQKKFPKRKFICQDVTEPINSEKTFDIVFSEALMAGLTDEQVLKMLENIKNNTTEGSTIILSDMDYKKENSAITNFLLEHERNTNLRQKADYIKLIKEANLKIKQIVDIDNAYLIPYSKVLFICSK